MSVFDSVKRLSGASYNSAIQSSRDILDAAYLRRARQENIRLPTAGNVDRERYWGALVFEPVSGINRNVLYEDLSSMYPNIFRALNASYDTVIGPESSLEQSEWGVEDTVWGYIDTREIKHLSEGEDWKNFTQPEKYKMIYDPNKQKVRWKDPEGPRYEKCYFVDPNVKKGFVTDSMGDWIAEKGRYTGTLYDAIKAFLVNANYGVHGDKKFRLFDWYIAESITLCGRMIIRFTAETTLDYLEDEYGVTDAYVAIGDSVPADEPVIIKGRDGEIKPCQIGDLQALAGEVSVWTEDGFADVERVIRKPNRKQMYAVRTKSGVVRVTEDHSLVLQDGSEISPEDVSLGDELLHSDLEDVGLPENDRTFTDDQAWLLGLFTADGTCNHYQYDHRHDKYPFAISKNDRDLLEAASERFESEWGFNTTVNDVRESSGCLKLQSSGNGDGERREMVKFLRKHCYTDQGKKRVPPTILNGSPKEREAFVEGYLSGDGFREEAQTDGAQSFSSNSRVLIDGLVMILREMGWEVTINRRENHGKTYHRVRMVSFHRGSSTEVVSIDPIGYDGDYVYDLQTANGHFHAGVGSIVVHNTDGAGICWPAAPSRDVFIDYVTEAVEYVNEEAYGPFMHEQFGVDPNAHYMEVELESYAPSLFVPAKNPQDPTDETGVKKRYAQWITLDESDEEDEQFEEVDDISITGLEATRSDVAWITREAQRQVLEWVLTEDRQQAKRKTYEYLRGLHDTIQNGDRPLNECGKRAGIGQPLSEYGSETRRPSPIYRGAKFASKHLDDVHLGEGSKPLGIYVDYIEAGADIPNTYSAETAEDGDPVDVISLEDVTNLPDSVVVDYDKHVDKALVGPLRPILQTLDWSWRDLLSQTEQIGFDILQM